MTWANDAAAKTREIDAVRSDTGTESSTSVVCAQCSHVNGATQQFCTNCGKQLWEKCPSCKTPYAVSEKFCGSCGANLATALQRELDRAEAALSEAEQLRDSLRFTPAIALLRSVSGLEHTELKPTARRVEVQLEKLNAERKQYDADLETALADARQLMADESYVQVVQVLRKLPAAMQSDEVDALIRQAEAKAGEVPRLEAEIRRAIQDKDYVRLGPTLHRLLKLKPEHADAKRLAGQLRDRFVQASQRELGKQRYNEAFQRLDEIPLIARNAQVEKLRSHVREVCWLLNDLRHAPFVDKPLLGIGERLCQVVPKDKQVAGLVANLQRQYREGSKCVRFPYPAWDAPPKSVMGCPLNWLGGSSAIAAADDSTRARLKQHSGQFYVALGLALQGLGRASVATNLLPKQNDSFLGRIVKNSRKPPQSASWGFDFGESGLKIVRLNETPDGGVVVDHCQLIPYGRAFPASTAIGAINDLLKDTLAIFLLDHSIPANDVVCAGMSGKEMLGKTLWLPISSPKKLAAVLRFEVPQQIPVPMEELTWDYHAFAGENLAEDARSQYVLLLATKKLHVQARMRVFEELNVPLSLLQGETVALHNFAQFEKLSNDPRIVTKGKPPIALLDMGGRSTNVVVSATDFLWFRTAPVGGDDVTDALANGLKLTREQAEELKRDPLKAKRVSHVYDVIDPRADRLVDELQRTLNAYNKDYPERRICHALAVGGGFRLHGLLNHLYADCRGRTSTISV